MKDLPSGRDEVKADLRSGVGPFTGDGCNVKNLLDMLDQAPIFLRKDRGLLGGGERWHYSCTMCGPARCRCHFGVELGDRSATADLAGRPEGISIASRSDHTVAPNAIPGSPEPGEAAETRENGVSGVSLSNSRFLEGAHCD